MQDAWMYPSYRVPVPSFCSSCCAAPRQVAVPILCLLPCLASRMPLRALSASAPQPSLCPPITTQPGVLRVACCMLLCCCVACCCAALLCCVCVVVYVVCCCAVSCDSVCCRAAVRLCCCGRGAHLCSTSLSYSDSNSPPQATQRPPSSQSLTKSARSHPPSGSSPPCAQNSVHPCNNAVSQSGQQQSELTRHSSKLALLAAKRSSTLDLNLCSPMGIHLNHLWAKQSHKAPTLGTTKHNYLLADSSGNAAACFLLSTRSVWSPFTLSIG